jgi:hypothetical protein
MSEIKKNPKSKFPGFVYNPALNALKDKPMFEDKIARAKETIERIGMPIAELITKARKEAMDKKSKTSQKELPAFLFNVDFDSYNGVPFIEGKSSQSNEVLVSIPMYKDKHVSKLPKTPTKRKKTPQKAAI